MKTQHNKWFLYLLGIATCLLIAATILRLLTPQAVEVPQNRALLTNINKTKSSFNTITFSGKTPTVPTEFSIAKINQTFPTQPIINAILSHYQLVQSSPDTWQSDSGRYYFNYQKDLGIYILLDASLSNERSLATLDLAIVQPEAEKLIQSLFPDIDIQIIPAATIFASTDGHLEETSLEEAEAATFAFSYTMDGTPVVPQNKIDYPFLITIDSEKRFRRLDFSPSFFAFSIIGKTPSISVDQAIQNIQDHDQAAIIAVLQQQKSTLTLSEIVSADLTTVSIEYRSDSKTGYLYPFYRFTGKALNQINDELTIELITPAVAVK